MSNWKNRIVGYEDVAVDQIDFHPENWRIHPKHQQEVLDSVIREVGVVQNVIVNKRTGRLIDGHLRVILADRNGEKTIPATIVDISAEEESKILATLDPISALAGVDREKLAGLLHDVHTTDATLQQFCAEMAEKAGAMPPADAPGDPGPQAECEAEVCPTCGQKVKA